MLVLLLRCLQPLLEAVHLVAQPLRQVRAEARKVLADKRHLGQQQLTEAASLLVTLVGGVRTCFLRVSKSQNDNRERLYCEALCE